MIVRNAGRVRRMWSGGKASLPFCTFAPVGFDFSVQPRVSVKVYVFRGRVFICCSPAYPMTSPLYNICTRCGRRGHCAASCKEPINDRVEGRDAALSRRVPSHDGLDG